MNEILFRTTTPLISLFVVMLSNGLFNTLTTVRLHQEGYTSLGIGLLGASFYAGLFLASFKIESVIVKVGHIRAYAAFAAGLTVVYLFHGMLVHLWSWLLLRILCGICTAGLFVVIESWLLVMSNVQNRGRVLAVYMVLLYSGQALGQFFLHVGEPEALLLFAVAAAMSALSIIPLALTKIANPVLEMPSLLNFKKLLRLTFSGLVGCFAAGMLSSVLYSLIPLYISQQLHDEQHIPLIMALTIFGGMVMQYPIGKLSDVIERRKILIALNACAVACSLAFVLVFDLHYLIYVLFFCFGGIIFTLYPISISSACDSLESKDVTAGTQALLVAYSAGAVLGPLVAPLFMRSLGPNGLFSYFIVVNLLMLVFIGWRRTQTEAPPQEDHFIPIVHTSPVINEMDPRSEETELEPTA